MVWFTKMLEKFKVEDKEEFGMKLKTHKIRGVDKVICTAEQKIAYNLTFANYYTYREQFNSLPTEIAKSQAIFDLRNHWLKLYRCSRNYVAGKYNEDAIAVALTNGIRAYMEKPFIAGSYEEIGKVFTIPYELM